MAVVILREKHFAPDIASTGGKISRTSLSVSVGASGRRLFRTWSEVFTIETEPLKYMPADKGFIYVLCVQTSV